MQPEDYARHVAGNVVEALSAGPGVNPHSSFDDPEAIGGSRRNIATIPSRPSLRTLSLAVHAVNANIE